MLIRPHAGLIMPYRLRRGMANQPFVLVTIYTVAGFDTRSHAGMRTNYIHAIVILYMYTRPHFKDVHEAVAAAGMDTAGGSVTGLVIDAGAEGPGVGSAARLIWSAVGP